MVKNFIFGAFLYIVMTASTRALQHLYHWGSGSNGLVGTGQLIFDPNTVLRGFFLWYVKM